MQTETWCSRYWLPAQPQGVLPTLHYLKSLQKCWGLGRLRESIIIREALPSRLTNPSEYISSPDFTDAGPL